jgi:hypothetical protein
MVDAMTSRVRVRDLTRRGRFRSGHSRFAAAPGVARPKSMLTGGRLTSPVGDLMASTI